jgi:hypothetical protein
MARHPKVGQKAMLAGVRVPCSLDESPFFNRLTPSTHSGELTLGTWLLQRPTHIDHGPTELGRDASAVQLHLKDPESSLS